MSTPHCGIDIDNCKISVYCKLHKYLRADAHCRCCPLWIHTCQLFRFWRNYSVFFLLQIPPLQFRIVSTPHCGIDIDNCKISVYCKLHKYLFRFFVHFPAAAMHSTIIAYYCRDSAVRHVNIWWSLRLSAHGGHIRLARSDQFDNR